MGTTPKSTARAEHPATPRNEIAICGRLVHDPVTRTMPSGDTLVSLRVSVPRVGAPRRPAGPRRAGADWIDCTLWSGRLRRAAEPWAAGDWVEVSGQVRRRYFPTTAGGASIVEVDARTARRVSRADRSQSLGAALD